MTTPLQVKICGITNRQDAETAIAAGADALGFNLYPGSKRHVLIENVTPWVSTLAGGTLRVAVMVNPTLEEILRVQPVFDVIQLHGRETPAFCAQVAASGVIWKAFPLTPHLDSASTASFKAASILINSAIAGPTGAYGGTGSLIDLGLASQFVARNPASRVWLSGGLNPRNVALAVERVHPYGVNVASGVEVSGDPRRKDSSLIHAFIAAARRAGGSS